MSDGSVLQLMVSVTMPFETETTLMLLETWLTTQASSLLEGFTLTDTGSIPTGISPISAGAAGLVRAKTDKVALGVLRANRREPSADMRMGLVWAPSKLTNADGVTCPSASTGSNSHTPAVIASLNSAVIAFRPPRRLHGLALPPAWLEYTT